MNIYQWVLCFFIYGCGNKKNCQPRFSLWTYLPDLRRRFFGDYFALPVFFRPSPAFVPAGCITDNCFGIPYQLFAGKVFPHSLLGLFRFYNEYQRAGLHSLFSCMGIFNHHSGSGNSSGGQFCRYCCNPIRSDACRFGPVLYFIFRYCHEHHKSFIKTCPCETKRFFSVFQFSFFPQKNFCG